MDFGNIGNVINHDAPDNPIELSFVVTGEDLSEFLSSRKNIYTELDVDELDYGDVTFTAKLKCIEDRTSYYSTTIECDGARVEAFWTDDAGLKSIEFNGKVVADLDTKDRFYIDTTQLFPEFALRTLSDGAILRGRPSGIYPRARTELYSFLHKKVAENKKQFLSSRLFFMPRHKIREAVFSLDHVVRSRLSDDVALDSLYKALFINDFPHILAFVAASVTPALQSAGYLGPARASGARFYRIQELAVGRVDSRGANLAMYLNSLSEAELNSFNAMMEASCGYRVRINNIPGHLSIEIGSGDDSHFENLADVGFGFSQFMPIVAQIHASIFRARANLEARFGPVQRSRPIIAIEQPELHLHPAFQARLGDLFAGGVRASTGRATGARFVIETHSEALVERLGSLVSDGKLRASDIALYFVEKEEETNVSQVRLAEFRPDGSVDGWPIGFFSASL